MADLSVPGSFAKHFQCACCKNPWNQVTENESESKSSPLVICEPCLSDTKGYSGLDPANFDPAVCPTENFFLWSNGGWMKKNPIPAEYSSWNTFIALRDLNLERLQSILEDLQKEDKQIGESDSELSKLRDYYAAFMNEAEVNAQGIKPLESAIALALSVKESNVTQVIAKLHSHFGVSVFFGSYSAPDKANSDHSLCSLYQSGLGMPDRDYYLDADKADKRDKYLVYLQQIFALLGKHGVLANHFVDDAACRAVAQSVLDFETRIAKLHLTRTESRDPQRTYNKMSVAALATLSQNALPFDWATYLARGIPTSPFDWATYFELIGKPVSALGEINVSSVSAVSQFPSLLHDAVTQSPLLSHYLLFHVVNSLAPHLSSEFVDAHFLFHEKEMKGTAEQQPRWKRALHGLETALGDALGKLYVKKHFPPDAKHRALAVVESVRDALRERLHEVRWMSDASRVEALKKMEKFKVKIGYPDVWRDYSLLTISTADHVENVLAARQFHFKVELTRMNAPTDKQRWFMTPQTVNAYYHPSLNEIVFPAAILQPPFFDANADLAVQYGSLGAVVGHEMTHGFDDQGRKYDSVGNLRDWWAAGDGEEYERRAAVMVKQAETFEVYGLKLNGKLTCGENIADLGGMKLALRALQKQLTSDAPLINGLTPVQRFFLAWSQSWRENVKKERAIQLVTLDPHGPNELRCNGTLSNIAEFHEAFNVQPTDKMFRPASERVDIW